MNAHLIQEITEAILYEGYVLYPYRATSPKNRRERFTFGRVYPEAYSLAQRGLEPFVMRTECLASLTGETPRLEIQVRFLHPIAREIGVLEEPLSSFERTRAGTDSVPFVLPEPKYHLVPELRVGQRLYQAWHEASERAITIPPLDIAPEAGCELAFPFEQHAARELEPIHDGRLTVGLILRRQEALQGRAEVAVRPLEHRLWKISVAIVNATPVVASELQDTDAIALRTLASTHTVLHLQGGEFISLMDPPPEHQDAAKQCRNEGTWPVLVGDETNAQRDTMLSSPIVLYDYPKIAPQSPGPMFDGTEIDEILTLRILTLTDAEKAEMAQLDEHGRRLLERTESLSRQSMLRLHGQSQSQDNGQNPFHPAPILPRPDDAGAWPGSTPAGVQVEFDDFFGASTPLHAVRVNGTNLRAGDRVRIRPKARADIMDLKLAGQVGIIQAIEQDLEKRIHLALVLENDPGRDLGLMRQTGHRFFYGLDEVEPVRKGET